MAKFQTCIFAHPKRKDGSFLIKLRVSHQSEKRFISTSLVAKPEDVTRTLTIKNEKLKRDCQKLIDRCTDICKEIGYLIDGIKIDELVAQIKAHLSDDDYFRLDFIEYMTQQAAKMSSGTASVYKSARNALRRYVGRDTLDIQEITGNFVRGLVDFVQTEPSQRGANRKDDSGHSQTAKGSRAVSLYMTRIKAIYNRAKEEFNDEDLGIIRITGNPFKNIKVAPPAPTAKRAVSAEVIQQIIDFPSSRRNALKWPVIALFCRLHWPG